MNNKGFMMAEVIVVATIVLMFLSGLYFSYNKLFSLYNTRINYYDSSTLYELAYYRDELIREGKMNDAILDSQQVKDIFSNLGILRNDARDKVYLIHNAMQPVKRSMLSGISSINPSYLDYVDYLSTSIEFKSNHIMIMERCIVPEGMVNEYTCTYAYLEVYDGKE